jgi:signal transduction histidine kinase
MADFPAAGPGIFSARVLRRLLAIFLPAALLTSGVVLAVYYQDLTNEQTLSEQAADHQVDLQSDLIRREMKLVQSDLLYLANQTVLRDFLAGLEKRDASPQRQQGELQDEYVLFCQQRGVYDQIRYLDAAGQERIRVNYGNGRATIVPEQQLQPKAGRYYFAQAMLLDRGQVFVSPFDLNIEHDQIERPLKPVIRFATPVFDRSGVKRGILALNYLGAALLGKLAQVSAGFPGAVWLLNGDGFFLRGPSPQDEWGFMLGHDRTLATYFPEEWQRLLAVESRTEEEGAVGQFRTGGGLFTFRTVALDPRSLRLVVLAHVPPSVLDGRANVLLRRLSLLSGVVLLLLLVLAWYLAYAAALRRDHERHLAESAARLRTLSTRLLTAQEDERRSLSRDLHDDLGQVVTSVTLDLQRATQARDGERKDELIGRALHGAGCLLDRIHEISERLRPTLLDDLGLEDAVRSFLADYERRTGIPARTELSFEQPHVPPTVRENVYRILQEALTNVARHAQATEVQVRLRVSTDAVTLTVRDDGVGLAPEALDNKRLGILGMRERAELLDGTFVLKGEPGRGTEVSVAIPLPKA